MPDLALLRARWGEKSAFEVVSGPPADAVDGGWSMPLATPILGCAWSADGRRVAVASGGRAPGADGTVWVLDRRDGATRRLLGHTAGTHGVAFDAATGWLATAGHDGILGLWDLEAGTGVGRRGPVACHRVAFARDRPWLAYAEELPPPDERAAVAWLDLATAGMPWRHLLAPGHLATALAVDPAGTRVAIVLLRWDGRVNQVICWETPSGRRAWRRDLDEETLAHDLRWSAHGFVQSDSDARGVRRLRLLDPVTGAEQRAVAVGESVMGGLDVAGNRAASVSSEGVLVLCRLPDLEVEARVDLGGIPSMAVALAPDGTAVAVGAADGRGLLVRPLSPP